MSNRNIKIFVGNLPFETNEDELKALVHGCGNPRHVVIKREQHSGRSRGYGYVEYKTEAECVEAIKYLAGKEVKGRPIKVDFWDDYYRDKYADLLMSIAYPKGEAGGSKPGPGKKHEHVGQNGNQGISQQSGFGSQPLGQAAHGGDAFPPLSGQAGEHFPPGVGHAPLQPQFPGVGMEQLYQQPLPFGMPLVPPGGVVPLGLGKTGGVIPPPPGLPQPPMGLGLGQPALLSGVPVGHAGLPQQPFGVPGSPAFVTQGPGFVGQPAGSPLLHPQGQLSSFMGHPGHPGGSGQVGGAGTQGQVGPLAGAGPGPTATFDLAGGPGQVGPTPTFDQHPAVAHPMASPPHSLDPLLTSQPLLSAGMGPQPLPHAFGPVAQSPGFAAKPAGPEPKRLRPEEPLLPEGQLGAAGPSTHPIGQLHGLARDPQLAGQPGQQLLLDNGRVVNGELFSLIKRMSMQDVSKLVRRIDALMEKSPNGARSVLNASPSLRSSLVHAKLLLGYKGLGESAPDPKAASQFSSVDSSSIFDYFVIH